MRPHLRLAIALVLGAAAPAAPACAAVVVPSDFVDRLVAGDLVEPVNFDFLPDGRLLIVERATARIRLVVPGAIAQPGPVGTIPDVEAGFGDQGLLGIAVDPRWPASPYVYVHHTCASGPTIRIERWTLSGDLAHAAGGALTLDPQSRRDVLADLPSTLVEHNGGTLVFGPDSLLYAALGDDDVRCAAQDVHDYRGKILRLDVRGIPEGPGPAPPLPSLVPADSLVGPDPVADLVWHLGLRNPWSFDFDPVSGAMAIADVGNSGWEEIDIVPSGRRNFGWPMFEGPAEYDANCAPGAMADVTSPDYAYPHAGGGALSAVILGGVCRPASAGPPGAFPAAYWSDVFFLDLYTGRLRRLKNVSGGWTIAAPVAGQPSADDWGTGFQYVPRMRFGADGALWYVGGSTLHRIAARDALVGVPPVTRPGPGALARSAAPNPASGAVAFTLTLPRPGAARLDVFDADGRLVRRLADAPEEAGTVRRTWDGRGEHGERVRPGVYFARLAVSGQATAQRLVVLAP